MSAPSYFWAITGRMPFDDEDCPYATPMPCSREEAEYDFRQFMVDTALDDESEDDIRQRLGLDTITSLTDCVHVISMFYSKTLINHG